MPIGHILREESYEGNRIITRIGFVCCIIGAAGALIGGVVLLASPAMSEELAKLIMSEMENISVSVRDLGIGLIAESIFLIGQAVALGFSCSYYKNELLDGTPFTYEGAKKLMTTGIINLAVPFGAMCVSTGIIAMTGIEDLISIEYEITAGVAMILASCVFTYGTDVAEGVVEGTKYEQV